jgi:hypothetical protein
MAIERVEGTLLSPEDVDYNVRALELLQAVLRQIGSAPQPKLVAYTERLCSKSGVNRQNASPNARFIAGQPDSLHHDEYATVDTSQAARILGITPNGVRDLHRRGRLPARRDGGRWAYPVDAVMRRAEHRRS